MNFYLISLMLIVVHSANANTLGDLLSEDNDNAIYYDKKDWNQLKNSGWGKREIDDDLPTKWNFANLKNFLEHKRQPGWTKLKGSWGKRNNLLPQFRSQIPFIPDYYYQ